MSTVLAISSFKSPSSCFLKLKRILLNVLKKPFISLLVFNDLVLVLSFLLITTISFLYSVFDEFK